MASKITITRSNSSNTLTTYQINNFRNLLIQDQIGVDQIADLVGDETTAINIVLAGTLMKMSFDFDLIPEANNVITAGILTSGTAVAPFNTTTINDTNQAWATNQFANEQVTITAGTNNGQTKTITSNTATQLTTAAFSSAMDGTSQYKILITSPVGQQIYLNKQFATIKNASVNGQTVPIIDTYTITLDYGETNARTFVETANLANLTIQMSSDSPLTFSVHLDFLIGTVG